MLKKLSLGSCSRSASSMSGPSVSCVSSHRLPADSCSISDYDDSLIDESFISMREQLLSCTASRKY